MSDEEDLGFLDLEGVTTRLMETSPEDLPEEPLSYSTLADMKAYQIRAWFNELEQLGYSVTLNPTGELPKVPPFVPSYKERGRSIGELVDVKNAAYGDSFNKSGDILKVLYPDGVPVEKYTDMLTITRVIDKLFRIATAKDALGESPFQDIAGYALLALGKK